MRLRTSFSVMAGAVAAIWFSSAAASAEFLQTGPGVYQTPREKIVVSHEAPGLFIATGPARDMQLFDPSQLPIEDTLHVFVRYDPDQRSYSALLFGQSEYRIRGSLVLSLGRARIAIDNSNPYLTVVVDEESSVIGFEGLKQIVMAKSEAAVALLEANGLNSFAGPISPYVLNDGNLFLKGQRVGQVVGLSLRRPENICLNGRKKAVYVTQTDLRYIKQGATPDQRMTRLRKVLDESAERDPFEHALHLRVEKQSVISIDYREGVVSETVPMKSKLSAKVVCLVKELRF